jgi:hypothetical protein
MYYEKENQIVKELKVALLSSVCGLEWTDSLKNNFQVVIGTTIL